jgi:F-type H+-transporting ATPase subunit a
MIFATLIVSAFMLIGSSRKSLVPGRFQSMVEMSYEFVANMVKTNAGGTEGMRFFPFVFSLFMFILVANMMGMFPYFYTVTSQMIVTAAFALFVISMVIVYGVWRNGFKFLKLFVPSGVPIYIIWFVIIIEVFSFMSRPVSLAVRLFANMLAGHIALKVFAGFVVMMLGSGIVWLGAMSILPLLFAVALTALEILVAFLQAYVFAILTCIYLNDAIHPGH